MTVSAIFAGDVVHARFRPRRHRLHYRVFSLLLDLDELEGLSRRLRLFGYNRPALFSFRDADHGDGQLGGLRNWVEARVHAAGLALDHPRVSVLCYPRILGYVFNPLTLYFVADETGRLRAVLYEVCNTFGERHTYIISTDGGPVIRHGAPKLHYVSPFMPMACFYHFTIRPPADRVLVRIDEEDGAGRLLQASFAGRRQCLDDRSLLRMFFAYPLMTLKVTAAIHWEALRLLAKGLPVFAHRPAPGHTISTHHAPRDRQPEGVGQGGQEMDRQ